MALGWRNVATAEQGAGLAKSAKQAGGFIPKTRLDALTDGVFAFAMTLLVVNIELPQGFDPKTNQEFLAKLADLSDTFIAYLIAFFVLVSFWFARAQPDNEPETVSQAYGWAVLFHLLGVTCAVLDARGRPLRRGRRRLDLRRQYDPAGRDGARHQPRRRAGRRARGRGGRTRRTRHFDIVRRAVHDRRTVLAGQRHVFLPAQSRLAAGEARGGSGIGGSGCPFERVPHKAG